MIHTSLMLFLAIKVLYISIPPGYPKIHSSNPIPSLYSIAPWCYIPHGCYIPLKDGCYIPLKTALFSLSLCHRVATVTLGFLLCSINAIENNPRNSCITRNNSRNATKIRYWSIPMSLDVFVKVLKK